MRTIRAIYERGVFRPLEPVTLPEQSPVKVTIEPSESNGDAGRARLTALRAVFAMADRANISICSPLPTRDELHERR